MLTTIKIKIDPQRVKLNNKVLYRKKFMKIHLYWIIKLTNFPL